MLGNLHTQTQSTSACITLTDFVLYKFAVLIVSILNEKHVSQ